MNQKLLLSSALLVGMAGTQQAFAQKKKVQDPKKPNVVFILADDLGFGDLSCYGQEKFETPNIDKLAQEGMRFTQCYSGTTVSAPSRSCLLTGTHSGHTAIRGNVELDPEGQFPLPADAQTIFRTQDTKPALSVNGGWDSSALQAIRKNKESTNSTVTTANCWHTATILITCGTMTNG